MFTKLKRTATITSNTYSNCAFLTNEDVLLIENNFPHIANEFRNDIIKYNDDNMEFRRKMIRNLHYLRNMDDDIINMIISKLEVIRYSKN